MELGEGGNIDAITFLIVREEMQAFDFALVIIFFNGGDFG
jgi:hypothetical protein